VVLEMYGRRPDAAMAPGWDPGKPGFERLPSGPSGADAINEAGNEALVGDHSEMGTDSSARDPKYTVVPQRERSARRAASDRTVEAS
jgi:hypothetical protein